GGTQVTDVAKHFPKRYVRLDTYVGGAWLLALDHPTTSVQVTDDVTHVGVGHEHVHLHDRFQQFRSTLGRGLTVSGFGSRFERHLRRVDRVKPTIVERHLDVEQREAN